MPSASRVKPRKRKCKAEGCEQTFEPRSSLQQACSPPCAIQVARSVEAKKKRKDLKARKEGLKTLSQWTQDAQTAFNAYIRARDAYYRLPCVSCDKPHSDESNAWDCGHYRTVGAAPELRYEELNAHRQCKSCNSGVRRTGSKVIRAHDPERAKTIRERYREELIRRIGKELVEWLEGSHEPKRYRISDLKAIRDEYRQKLKSIIDCLRSPRTGAKSTDSKAKV